MVSKLISGYIDNHVVYSKPRVGLHYTSVIPINIFRLYTELSQFRYRQETELAYRWYDRIVRLDIF